MQVGCSKGWDPQVYQPLRRLVRLRSQYPLPMTVEGAGREFKERSRVERDVYHQMIHVGG